mmetsp:Transcript_34124/g.96121  ORF Transcript_34124/g.96121 Transcript_34124/m.96121 type:complete len:622 (-) Transcript_34124:368-2233(-)|eukprot:CAMPEP_0119121020 /NCGR_PEP_ID=MMETSP1310-20130426/1825_1 /TAXON_ID=464262 /ORGANISM="Genus nov. species nov., Strain RCC2339" /LENGTH=621 /DNA_ID=CAMNT_0007110551 /DNA_START=114 /DNA_END=1979 /DNA_ORIENTATION=-
MEGTARVLVLGVLVAVVMGDTYMHMIPGSNNRLDEANRDRANGNRLFDSQNNNRGGYNVASLELLEDSEFEISWTNQHGLGDQPRTPYNEIIVQMMCDNNLRDGTTTQRIPDEPEADLDFEFGRHESYAYYQSCKQRERNQGLFTASQNLRGDSAIYTRQNPNGNRNGLECPEERDYYPYWQPSPWMDVAVLTSDMRRCAMYQEESQNVKPRWVCDCPAGDGIGPNHLHPITEDGCNATGGTWRESPAWGLPPPDCVAAPWTRDNHLGNTVGGYPPTYTLRIPTLSRTNLSTAFSDMSDGYDHCVMRMRYNISTDDYSPWNTEEGTGIRQDTNFTDARYNDQDGLALGLSAALGYEAKFENNPQVNFGLGVELQLAINTAQLGRTFQDRSHRMAVVQRTEDTEGLNIKNLNVQGKRGNIVQVFPGVEYDFMPNILRVTTDDYIHVQFSGSNTNPNNNDGQGQNGSDRSNMAPTADNGRVYPEWANVTRFMDGNQHLIYTLSRMEPCHYGGEMSELDDASPYFDYASCHHSQRDGLIRLTKPQNVTYMGTRNNNFSNRSQRGTIVVVEGSGAAAEESDDIALIAGALGAGIVCSLLIMLGLISVGKQMANKQAPEGYLPANQ